MMALRNPCRSSGAKADPEGEVMVWSRSLNLKVIGKVLIGILA